MKTQEIFARFHEVAAHPEAQLQGYLKAGKKVVLVAPVYTPEEVIHAMGFVPMGAWGADAPLNQAKEYFPAFLCSIVQSILEMGMKGVYEGAVALVVPSLCDSLKCLGQNWKYAVPGIPFILALRQLCRHRMDLVDYIADQKRKIIGVMDRVFPEYQHFFTDMFGKT
ncbi:MAG: 2-hydroxyacyl-CoA dehydratase family protein, partial [Clostridiales bacterium]|nr:2-hydroxyacyl-CoA dehydratase family protein [Clostridiales bacterium]